LVLVAVGGTGVLVLVAVGGTGVLVLVAVGVGAGEHVAPATFAVPSWYVLLIGVGLFVNVPLPDVPPSGGPKLNRCSTEHPLAMGVRTMVASRPVLVVAPLRPVQAKTTPPPLGSRDVFAGGQNGDPGMTLPVLFADENEKTVGSHFRWMLKTE
jgi:hypothetical protein